MSDTNPEALAKLELSGEGQLCVTGELGFKSVPLLYTNSLKFFRDGSNLDIDLAGVTHTDSAGVALLIEWLRQAQQQNRNISFRNIPSQLLAIARLCGVVDMLSHQA